MHTPRVTSDEGVPTVTEPSSAAAANRTEAAAPVDTSARTTTRDTTPSGPVLDALTTGKFRGIGHPGDDPARTGEFLAAPGTLDETHPLAGLRYESFEIDRPIGSGGIAELHLARHPAHDADFVVKVARASLASNPHVRRQFEREWRATRQLKHPGVVDHHSHGDTADARPFLTMDLVVGRSLSHFVSHPVSWRFLKAAMCQLCDILGYVHRRSVLHQDLKPSNILVDLKRRRLRLTDFGLAHFGRAQSGTTTRSVLGTPSYMAPEQARGQLGWLGPHTDLYTVGVMLFELLCGYKPFEDESDRVVMIKHCTCPPPPLEARAEVGAPDAVAAIVERLLAKTPEGRYADAAELKAALTALP